MISATLTMLMKLPMMTMMMMIVTDYGRRTKGYGDDCEAYAMICMLVHCICFVTLYDCLYILILSLFDISFFCANRFFFKKTLQKRNCVSTLIFVCLSFFKFAFCL